MYILYDDIGVMKTGSFLDCKNAILNWCKTQEAKKIYSKLDLNKIFNFFSKLQEKDLFLEMEIEFYGFYLKKE